MNFDSNEEMYMDWWLQELKKLGYVKEIIHQPEPFELSESLWVNYYEPYKRPKKDGPEGKMVPEEIIPKHVYTTDIKVIWDESALGIFTTPIRYNLRKKKGAALQYILCESDDRDYNPDKGDITWVSYIEVKPVFDQNNMTRLAKINQKWVFEKFDKYINIVVPEKHFNKTFTPQKYFFTNKTKKPRQIRYKNIITLKEFLRK
jgi:hypothetical protein